VARATEALRRRLARAEAAWLQGRRRGSSAGGSFGVASAAAQTASSWARSAFVAAVAALRLSVTNVHVRYEHGGCQRRGSAAAHPFAAGLTLAVLSAISVDDAGAEVSGVPRGDSGGCTSALAQAPTRKAVELRRLAVYLDSDAAPWDAPWHAMSPEDGGSWDVLFAPGVTQGSESGGAAHRQYILAPTSGTLHYTRAGEGGHGGAPRQEAEVSMGAVALALTTHQYRDASRLAATLAAAAAAAAAAQRAAVEAGRARGEDARGVDGDSEAEAEAPARPSAPPGAAPSGCWWRWALGELRCRGVLPPRLSRLRWAEAARGCALRRQYLTLYKGAASAAHPQVALLDAQLAFEVALLFRCLAHAQAEGTRALALAGAAARRQLPRNPSLLRRGAGYALRTAAGLVWRRREEGGGGAEAGAPPQAEPPRAGSPGSPDHPAFQDALDEGDALDEREGQEDETFHEAESSMEDLESKAEAEAAAEAAAAAAAALSGGAAPAPSAALMAPEDWAELERLIGLNAAAVAAPPPDALLALLRVSFASAALTLRVSAASAEPAAPSPADVVSLSGTSAAPPESDDTPQDATLHAVCTGFVAAARLFPSRHDFTLALHEWRAATPEGVFIRSAPNAPHSDAHAPALSTFELQYARLPAGGRHEHALSARLLPILVSAGRATAERLLAGARAVGDAASAGALCAEEEHSGVEGVEEVPSAAPAAAAAAAASQGLASLAAAAASAASRARAAASRRLAAALAAPPRVRLSLDLAAPKLLLPVTWAPSREGRAPFVLAVNLGHFQLRSEEGEHEGEGPPAEGLSARPAAAQPLCEAFQLRGRDVEVFFAAPGFAWDASATLPPPPPQQQPLLPLLRRVAFQATATLATPASRAQPGGGPPDVRLRLAAPSLDWEVSPARYWHCLDAARELSDDWAQQQQRTPGAAASPSQPPARPWTRAPPLPPCAADALTHAAGGLRHAWAPCTVAHSGAYLYVLDSPHAAQHRAAARLGSGTRVAAVPPASVGGQAHCLSIADAGLPPAQAASSRRALVLRFGSAREASEWLRVLRGANARLSGAASRPAALGPLELGAAAAAVAAATPPGGAGGSGVQHSPGGGGGGIAVEAVSPGGAPSAGAAETPPDDARVRWDVVASVGRLSLRIGARPQAQGGRGWGHLGDTPPPPPPPWGAPDEALIVVWRGQGGTLSWRHSRGAASLGLRLRRFTVHDVYCGGLMLASADDAAAVPDVHSLVYDPDAEDRRTEEAQAELTQSQALPALEPDAVTAPEDAFAVFTVRMWDLTCSDYAGTDSSFELALTRVALDLRRPTLASLWRGKDDTLGVPAANEREMLQTRAATLGEHKGRVLLRVGIAMRGAEITLWGTPAARLARIVVTDLAVDARVFPTSLGMSASLGGLRVANLKLVRSRPLAHLALGFPPLFPLTPLPRQPADHAHHWLLDAKQRGEGGEGQEGSGGPGGNLVLLELRSFAGDDPDACGRDYWLAVTAAGVRVVYLHSFADEVSSWFTGLLPHNPLRRPQPPPSTAALASGARPKLAVQIDASYDAPVMVLPRGTHSSDSVELDLGKASWRTSFAWVGGSSVHDRGAALLERTDVQLTRMRLACVLGGVRGVDATADGQLRVTACRPLWDPLATVPLYDVEVSTPALAMAIDDAEYLLLYGVFGANLSEPPALLPRLVPLPEPLAPGGASASGAAGCQVPPPVASASPDGAPRTTLRLTWRAPEAALQLFHAPRASTARPLATMRLTGFYTSYRGDSSGGWHTRWSFPRVSFRDTRPHTPQDLRDVIGGAGAGSAGGQEAETQPTMWFMELGITPGASLPTAVAGAPPAQPAGGTGPGVFKLHAGLQRVQFLFDTDFVLAVGRFFVPSLRPGLAEATAAAMARDIRVACHADGTAAARATATSEFAPVTFAPSSRVLLSPLQRLLADAPGGEDEVIYDGQGGTLVLPAAPATGVPSAAPASALLFVGQGRTLRLRNLTLVRASALDAHAMLAPGARICAEAGDHVRLVEVEEEDESSGGQHAASGPLARQHGSAPPQPQRRDTVVEVSATGLQLLLPESSPGARAASAAADEPAAAPASARRALRAGLDVSTSWRRAGGDSLSVTSHVQHLALWVQHLCTSAGAPGHAPVPLFAPADVLARVRVRGGSAEAVVDCTDLEARLSLRTLALCTRIFSDAAALFRGDGAARSSQPTGSSSGVLTATTAAFDLVWRAPGGADGCALAIWRPRAAEGYASLGDVATTRGASPSRAVITLNDACGLAEAPLGFDAVWSSSEVTLWAPRPPAGFAALGCVAGLGGAPPPRAAVRCVRLSALARGQLGDCAYMRDGHPAAHAPPSCDEAGDAAPPQPGQGSVWCVDNAACTFFASASLAPPGRDALLDLRVPLQAPAPRAGSGADAHSPHGHQAEASSWAASQPPQQPGFLPSARAVEFVRIWWDKGASTRRKLSLWRPVAPPGYVSVGDAAVEGHEPPRRARVVADLPGATARPVGFEPLWSSARSRCPEAVSFWAPVPPPGYVSLGHVASRSLSVPPGPACCACVRADLVQPGAPSGGEALWAEEGTAAPQRVLLWPLDPLAHTWLATPGRSRPRGSTYRLRDAAEAAPGAAPSPTAVSVAPPMHADIRLARLTLLLLQPGAGPGGSGVAPLAALSAHGVHCDAAGSGGFGALGSRRALATATLGLHFYNARVRAWEAVVEPAAVEAVVEQSGAACRATLSVTSPLSVTLSAAAADAAADAAMRERAAARAAVASAAREKRRTLLAASSSSASLPSLLLAAEPSPCPENACADLGEDVGAHTLFDNQLGRPLYLRYGAPVGDAAPAQLLVVELQPDCPRQVTHAWRGSEGPVAAPAWWAEAEGGASGQQQQRQQGGPPALPPFALPAPRRLVVRVRHMRGAAGGLASGDPTGRVAFSVALELRLPSDEPQAARTAAAGHDPDLQAAAHIWWEETFLMSLPRGSPQGLGELLRRAQLTVALVDVSALCGAGRDVASACLSLRDAQAALAAAGGWLHLPGVELGGAACELLLSLSVEEGAQEAPRTQDAAAPPAQAPEAAAAPPGGLAAVEVVHVSLSAQGPWAPLAVANLKGRTLLQLGGPEGEAACVDTELRDGARRVLLRPLLRVHNATAVPLALAIAPAGGPAGAEGRSVEEECFQTECSRPRAGWSGDALLPADPGGFSARAGAPGAPTLDAYLQATRAALPDGWAWQGPWRVDTRGHVDGDGWSYAEGPEALQYPFPEGRETPGALDVVRRRRWVRRRGRVAGATQFLPPLPSGGTAHLPRSALGRANGALRLQVRPLAGGYGGVTLEEHCWGEALPSGGCGSPLLACTMEGAHWLACVPSGAYAADVRAQPFWLGVRASAVPLSPAHADWQITLAPPLLLENSLPRAIVCSVWERPRGGTTAQPQPGRGAEAGWAAGHVPRCTLTLPPCTRRAVHSADPRAPLFMEVVPEGGWRAAGGRGAPSLACISHGALATPDATALPPLSACVRLVDAGGANLWMELQHVGGRMPHTLRVCVPFAVRNATDARITLSAVPLPPRGADQLDDDMAATLAAGDPTAPEQLRVVSTRVGGSTSSADRETPVTTLASHGAAESLALLSPCPPKGVHSASAAGPEWPTRWGLVVGTPHLGAAPALLLETESLERSATLINAVDGAGAKHQLVVRLLPPPATAAATSPPEEVAVACRTRTLLVSHYLVLSNHTGEALQVRQAGTAHDEGGALLLQPGAPPVPLVWTRADRPERLQLRTAASGWSAAFAVSCVPGDDAFVRLPQPPSAIEPSQPSQPTSLESSITVWLLRLQVTMRGGGGGAQLVFSRAGRAPVVLRNASPVALRFRQALPRHPEGGVHAHAAPWRTLPPHAAVSYAWERPLEAHVVEVAALAAPGWAAGGTACYKLGAPPAPPPQFGAGGSVNIQGPSAEAGGLASGHSGAGAPVAGAGEAQPLLALPRAPGEAPPAPLRAQLSEDEDVITLRLAPSSDARTAQHAPALTAPSTAPVAVEWTLALDVPDAVVSIVDATPEELLLASLVGIHVERSYGMGGGDCATLAVRLRRCQVDDMVAFTHFPVALYTRPREDGEREEGAPGEAERGGGGGEEDFLVFTLTERRGRAGADARARAFPYLGVRATGSELVLRISEASLWRLQALWSRYSGGAASSLAPSGVQANLPMHVSLLSLSRLALRVSFRTAASEAGRPPGALGALQALGLTLANVDEAQLELRPVVLEGVHARGEGALWRLLTSTVARQLRGQVLRLLQGVDLLDNVSNALGAASAGVAALSLDPAFAARRRGALAADARPRVATISDGLRDGGEALARSLLRGVTGLLTKPVEGARREGVEGFLKGVGKGLLGAATQPMSGVLDLVSSTTAGLSASWDTVSAVLSDERTHARRRLPRAVKGDGVLRRYDPEEAVGQQILRLATAGGASALGLDLFRARGAARSDTYEGHVRDLPGRRVAMVTNRRLMLLNRPDEDHDLMEDPCSALWQAEWRDILAVELHRLRGEAVGAPPSTLVVHLKRGRAGGGGARLMFDGDAFRALRRLVRCTPGTRQASTLAALIAAARERSKAQGTDGGGGGGGGGALVTGLVPRTASGLVYGSDGMPLLHSASAGALTSVPAAGGDSYDSAGESGDEGQEDEFDLEALALGGDPSQHADSLGYEDQEYDGDLAESEQASQARAPPGRPPAPPSPSPSGAPPALPCAGFARLWCSRGADEAGQDGGFRPVSLWRPLCPPGYARLGDVAQTGYDPPRSPVAVYLRTDPALAPPTGYSLVWRDSGSGAAERVTLWAPTPPPGFAALGCLAVAGDAQPEADAVRCVALERVRGPLCAHARLFTFSLVVAFARPTPRRCSMSPPGATRGGRAHGAARSGRWTTTRPPSLPGGGTSGRARARP